MPPHASASASERRQQDAGRHRARQSLRRRGGPDHQREHQQHADDLRAFRRRQRDDRQEQHGIKPQRHALRLGQLRLQAGEQQRPRDDAERARLTPPSASSVHTVGTSTASTLPNSSAVACVA